MLPLSFLLILFLPIIAEAVADISCSYTNCTLSNQCPVGTCNNGYCCVATGSRQGNKPKGLAPLNPASFLLSQNDWTGNNNMLGNVIFDNPRPDTSVCLGGFTSSIKCGSYDTCPPGLLCEQGIKYCCPLILPMDSQKQPQLQQPRKPIIQGFHHYRNPMKSYPTRNAFYSYPSSMQSYGSNMYNNNGYNYNNINYPRIPTMRYNSYGSMINDNGYNSMDGYRPRRTMWSYPCNTGDNCGYYNNYGTNYNSNLDGISGSFGPMSSLTTNSVTEGPEVCTQGSEAGSCGANGRCEHGYQCNGNNVCCREVVPATVCPDGTQAAGACVNGQCGFGFTCNQGLCCTNSSQTPRCLDGSQAIGACIGGKCGDGYACTTGNICCPSTTNGCPAGTTSIGPCVNGICPQGFSCVNDQCCGPPSLSNSTIITCPQTDSNGPCSADSTCPDPGFQCDVTNQWCCPNIAGDPVGPCIRGEGGARLCPDGYACSGADAGQCYRLDTGTCAAQDQFGPCSTTEPRCPNGYTCIGGFCCSDNAGNYWRRKRSFLRL